QRSGGARGVRRGERTPRRGYPLSDSAPPRSHPALSLTRGAMNDIETRPDIEPQDPRLTARPEPASTILVMHDDLRVHALLADLVEDSRGRGAEGADVGTGVVLAQTLRPDFL